MADSESLPMQGPPEPPTRVPPLPAPPAERPPRWSDPVVDVDRSSLRPPAPTNGGNSPPWMSVPAVGAAPLPPAPLPPAPPSPAPAIPPSAMPTVSVADYQSPAATMPTSGAQRGPAPERASTNPSQRVTLARPAAGAVVSQPPAQVKEDESLEERAFREAPSWLISALVHMLALIILGLIWAAPKLMPQHAEIDATYAEQLGVQLLDPSINSGENSPDHADKLMITPTDLAPVVDPFAAPRQPEIDLDGSTAIADMKAPTIGMALKGRQEGSRQSLLGRYGGNKLTEEAVLAGLAWLANQQRSDGSWSMKGPYSDGAPNENNEAATAMAMLAFQGHGETHKTGKYKKNVAAAMMYLLKIQGPDGNFYAGSNTHYLLYTHAQCTIAMCELYGMTKDSSLRASAEQAVKFCVDSQASEGGWRYQPRMDSDTSVTGWVVMALQSARMAGLTVPKQTLDRVSGYLDKASPNGGSLYGYQPQRGHDKVMTAEALLCRQYLGWDRYNPKLIEGADYVVSQLPNWSDRDVYYWYYGTQVMHHMGGDYWTRWNNVQRDMLVKHQETAGPEKGSWDPLGNDGPDAWSLRREGRRLYVTCLSIYMLEVYYRHMPLYADVGLR